MAASCLVCACATTPGERARPVELRDDAGFTITEEVRVGSKVRSDFEEALRRVEAEDYEGGIELLERVTAAAPHATSAHIDLGITLRLAGELERAEASLTRALELNPRHPVAHNELGIVQRKLGRFEEARASYEQALELFPDFHFARRNLAILCDVYLGDMACAMTHYELYTQVVPDDEKVVMWITDLRNRMGR